MSRPNWRCMPADNHPVVWKASVETAMVVMVAAMETAVPKMATRWGTLYRDKSHRTDSASGHLRCSQ